MSALSANSVSADFTFFPDHCLIHWTALNQNRVLQD